MASRILNSLTDNTRTMSFIRYGEERTYFHGESEAYIYPNGEGEIIVRTPGVMKSADFWEVVCRAVERVEGEQFAEEFAYHVEDHQGNIDS